MASIFRPLLLFKQPLPWPAAAINSQIDQSSQLLYLASAPDSALLIDAVRFIVNGAPAAASQFALETLPLALLSAAIAPVGEVLADPVRFRADSFTAIRSELASSASPIALLTYVASTTTVPRPPLGTRQPAAYPAAAIFSQGSGASPALLSSPVANPFTATVGEPVRFRADATVAINAQAPQSGQPLVLTPTPLGARLVDPIRFVANPGPALGSQAAQSPSSQELYLQSTPLSGQMLDPARFRADPSAAIASQFGIDRAPLSLLVLALPTVQELDEPQRFAASATVAIAAQAGLQQSSQLLYLASTPLSASLVEPIRFRADPSAAIASQSALDRAQLSLLVVVPPAVQGVVDPVRFVANPLPALTAFTNLEASSQLLYLASNPLSEQLVEPQRFTANPRPAIDAQTDLEASSQLLYLKSSPALGVTPDNPTIARRLDTGITEVPSLALRRADIPAGQRLDPIRFAANPWPSVQAQATIAGSTLLLATQLLPAGEQVTAPPTLPRATAAGFAVGSTLALAENLLPAGAQHMVLPPRASLALQEMQQGSAALRIAPPASASPLDSTAFPANPWPAISAQAAIGSTGLLLLFEARPPGVQLCDLPAFSERWSAFLASATPPIGPMPSPIPPPPPPDLYEDFDTEANMERILHRSFDFNGGDVPEPIYRDFDGDS